MTRTGVRIETMTGEGFFCADHCEDTYDVCDAIHDRHNWAFPSYNTDMELRKNVNDGEQKLSEYNFMYSTLEKFLEGFTLEELNILMRSEYYRVVYIEASDTFASEHQTVYRPSSVISTTDISDLFLINDGT